MNYLSHHGVQGQKWGVRRYQNPDGSLTAKGKLHVRSYNSRSEKTDQQVNEITGSFSEHDNEMFSGNKDKQRNDDYAGRDNDVLGRILIADGNTPVAFLDFQDEGHSYSYKGVGPFKKIQRTDKHDANVVIGVNSKYRGQGYASKVTEAGNKWIEKHKDELGEVSWSAWDDNPVSQHLAANNGYKLSRHIVDKEYDMNDPSVFINDYSERKYTKDFRDDNTKKYYERFYKKQNKKNAKRQKEDPEKYKNYNVTYY